MGISILIGVILVGWIIMLINLVFNIYKNLASKNWTKVDATIKYVVLNGDYDDDNTYKVATKYTYTIDDKTYTNNTIYYGYVNHSIKKHHEAIRSKLTKALIVTAFVNPRNHKQSVLCSSVIPWSKVFLVLSWGILMFRGLMFFYTSKTEILNPLWIGLLCALVIFLLINKKSVADSIKVTQYKPNTNV